MYKRILAFICIIGMIVFCAFPVSAATLAKTGYSYLDYATDIRVDGFNRIVTIELPVNNNLMGVWQEDVPINSTADGYLTQWFYAYTSDNGYPHYTVTIEPNYYEFLRLDNVPTGTILKSSLKIEEITEEQQNWAVYSPFGDTVLGGFKFYDSNFKQVYSRFTDFDSEYIDDSRSTYLQVEVWGYLQNYISGDTESEYIVDYPYVHTYVEFSRMTFDRDIFVKIEPVSFSLEMTMSSAYESGDEGLINKMDQLLAQQGMKFDKLTGEVEELNDKVDKLPGEIGDQMQGILDNEKNEANNSGNSSVDDMIEIIPDYSTGLIEGVKNLAACMSYEGLDCVLTMPALTIPALPGVTTQKYVLLDEQKVNLKEWFDRMPSEVMSVTRALFDIAIVGFCFYEFYDLVSQLANGARKPSKSSKGG